MSIGDISRPSALAVFRLINQLEFRRRLHRKIGGLFPFEDATDVLGRPTVLVRTIDSIGYEPTCGDELTERIDGGQPMPGRRPHDEIAMEGRAGVRQHEQAAVRRAREFIDAALDVRDVVKCEPDSSTESNCAADSID
jgi:hypothetical protein